MQIVLHPSSGDICRLHTNTAPSDTDRGSALGGGALDTTTT
jgi:hypothetical protein